MSVDLMSLEETTKFATAVGQVLHGGEVIELIGDVGSGKTTFTKGLALGLGVEDDVQSPSFTISRVYDARDGLRLVHYDFYRLSDPGIMNHDIAEAIADPQAVVVVEWGGTVNGVLPTDRTVISLEYDEANTNSRRVTIQSKVTEIGEVYAAWNTD
ncbi:MAG TPA: tRNA (adenosine(37)-N6)-threonylcarbamoyltransferase complex ATPase subunit type 1 TsaE [Candidatus Saccharibacteria bacterium]|nr:tRNA (adenosine(37)-N6)-threonylcarbamoyltransferase complex ATPase subunit type 1 TsaE [Candidatus Saccharibacteria bacterium]